MEQSIYIKMVHIAKLYDTKELRDKYLNAAQQFRFPYWDYFRPRGGWVSFPGVINDQKTHYPYDYSLPKILTVDKIHVRKYPKGALEKLDRNPLSFFPFPTGGIKPDEWNVFAKNVSQRALSRNV